MFARLYNVAWSRTGRDRPVLPMATIRLLLDAAGAATSDARSDFRYIKRGVLQLPGVASSQDYRANYLIYSNDNVHYFGAWVDSIDWSSAGSYAVTFTDDLFTTFAASAHVTGYRTRKPYDLIPAGKALQGDFGVCGWSNLWSWSLAFGENVSVLVYLAPGDTDLQYAYSPTPSTAFIAVIQDDTDYANFQGMLNDPLFKFSSIIAAYLIPSELIPDALITKSYKYNVISTPFTFKTFATHKAARSFVVGMPTDREQSYAVFLNDHDSVVRVRMGSNTAMLHASDLANYQFTVRYGFTPAPFLSVTPNYKSAIGVATRSPSYGFSRFPQAPLSSDAFASWFQSVVFPSICGIGAGAATGGVGALIGGAIGTAAGAALSSATTHMIPDYLTGDSSALFSAGVDALGIDILVPANWRQGETYYDQFGFPCASRETFYIRVTGGTGIYEFIQSTDNVIDGEMPAAAKDDIDQMLKAGVRVWSTIDIGEYI